MFLLVNTITIMDLFKGDSRLYIYLYGLLLFIVTASVMLRFADVLVYAVFLYYITKPIKNRLDNRIKSKDLAITVSLIVLVLPVILTALYSFSIASHELNQLLSANAFILNEYMNDAFRELEGIYLNLEDIDSLVFMGGNGMAVYDNLILSLLQIASILFKLFLTFALAFYFLKHGHEIKRFLTETLIPDGGETFTRFIESVDSSLQKIFFGNILTILVTSLIGVILFHLLNTIANPWLKIPYPLLFGILCGLGTLVPAVGIKSIWIPLFAYLGAEAYLNNLLLYEWPYLLVFLFTVNVFVDFTPDLLLRPLVSGKDMHKGSLMLAYIFGPAVFGFMGLFLGPIVLILIINFARIIIPENQRAPP